MNALTQKKKPGILAKFELKMTAKQVRETYKHFTADMHKKGNYVCAIQPTPGLKVLRVAILEASFGDTLAKWITAEEKRRT